MKIIKVLGVVAGIHLFAVMLILVNPGCSSTTKPSPAPIDTIAKAEPAPAITVPGAQPDMMSSSPSVTVAPISFNPDAPALAGDGVRFVPTRPGSSAASALVAAPVADVTPASTYTVKSGDNLWTIAKKNSLSASELAAANNLKSSAVLHDGQKLLIPSKRASTAATSAASTTATATNPTPAKTDAVAKAGAESVKHTVKSGETLGAIAKSYGVKVSDISRENNITDPQKIRPGTVLIIPGYKAIADKNAKSSGKPSANGSTAKPASTPAADATPVFGAPSNTPVPVIGPSGAAQDIPVIKLDDPSAAPKKP